MSSPRSALIFANGVLDSISQARAAVVQSDLIIAADGGARHCAQLGVTPDILIGDFDSLDEHQVAAFAQAGAEIIRHPTAKDETDLELAARLALDRGYHMITLLGALGARWDQTLANFLLPAAPGMGQATFRFLAGAQEIISLHGGGQIHLQGKPGDTVSLIPLAGHAYGISTSGLAYPLTDEVLYLGATRGTSNSMIDENASISLGVGLLLCVIIHKNFLKA